MARTRGSILLAITIDAYAAAVRFGCPGQQWTGDIPTEECRRYLAGV
ncbi:MAG: hypothetical protein WA691_04765 [Thermoplasmata archaeon]